MRRILAVVTLTITLAGCTDTVPMGTLQSDQTAKTFPVPPPGKAGLYVYRSQEHGAALDVTANQRMLGHVAGATYLRIDVAPGVWDIRCKSGLALDFPDSHPIALAAGSIIYVDIRVTASARGLCALRQVEPVVAMQAIAKLKRIQEVGGASD